MEKKVILITGASGGMGTHFTNWFKQQNVNLALHYFEAKNTMEASDSIAYFQADLTNEDEVNHMIEAVISRFGRVDVLINNAGISKSAMSWKTTLEDWNATVAVNLTAPFLVSKACVPAMRNAKIGRIINITSVVGQTGQIGTAAYAASKAGLIGLTKTMAKELAFNNITVNALALGYFSTGMIADVPQEQQDQIIESIPLKKLGDPAAVCKTVEWLISDEAAYVTGQVIELNGGLHM
ncbi:MAG: 3-oxoacyl-ACP reductase FabG [Crocinitomicaceae bacterium]|nr:3-oxoacyl-ACP reductase FabG [Crocinitomicaceae bacterium]